MLINTVSHQDSHDSFWQQCLLDIQKKIAPSTFETWFKNLDLDFDSNGKQVFSVPNQFFADFIEEHFSELLRETLSNNGITNPEISFVPAQKAWNVIENEIQAEKEIHSAAKASSPATVKPLLFRPHYTFGTFVVGDSNRMAHAASMAVAEAPGKTSFNPLFIFGGTGLGKTHLLQAIGHYAMTEGTAERVLYLTSQEFTSEYINFVINKKDSTSFYRKFDDVDLLLIDDIHFLSGKPGTQKEFFRIFNRLLFENKQIVLTSDRSPEKIPDMMDHLISRFLGGLTADIQPPNIETRIAIIQKKAESDGLVLPSEVIHFVAEQITSNVRELEGTMIKLIASCSFTQKDITIDVAREIFGDVLRGRNTRLTTTYIREKVAEHFSISPNQLCAHTRKREVVVPRSIAMYLCKKWTKQSLRTIGLDFGGRDYSTVIHACKKVEGDLVNDAELAKSISTLDALMAPLAQAQ